MSLTNKCKGVYDNGRICTLITDHSSGYCLFHRAGKVKCKALLPDGVECKNNAIRDNLYCQRCKIFEYTDKLIEHKIYRPGDKDILKTLGITDEITFKKWVRLNHPDKGGNTNLFADINSLYRKVY